MPRRLGGAGSRTAPGRAARRRALAAHHAQRVADLADDARHVDPLLRPELANAGRAAITRRVDAVQRALRRAASRLDALRPPKDAAAANRQAVEGMREFAQSLDAVRAAAASGTAEQLREAKAESSRSPGATKMNRALGELRDAGYRIG